MGTSASSQTVEPVKRRTPRTRTIGVRVTEPEFLALENEAWKTRKTIADWVRDQILGRPVTHSSEPLHERIFTELIAVELVLINALSPLLRGEQLTQEQLDALWKQVQTTKGRKAQELLSKRTNNEEKQS
jgi:hypothetical protein